MTPAKVNYFERVVTLYGISQKELAKSIDISEGYVTQILQGKKVPSTRILNQVKALYPKAFHGEFVIAEAGTQYNLEKKKPFEDALKRLIDDATDELIEDARNRGREMDLIADFRQFMREQLKKQDQSDS